MAWVLHKNPKDIQSKIEPALETLSLNSMILRGIDFDNEYRLAISSTLWIKLFKKHDRYTEMIGNIE